MAAPLYVTQSGRLFHAGLILIVTVGLPARGKTHISRALERYLRWMGVKTTVKSLGDYRRRVSGGAKHIPKDYYLSNGPVSGETTASRDKIRVELEDQIWKFFTEEGGQVCIYDANNSTKEARKQVSETFGSKGVHVIYLESLCDKDEIITANIRGVKLSSPDYKGWDPERAVADYWARIKDQEKHYDTVTADEGPFIKITNVGERIEVNRIEGYLQTRCCFFSMNIHTKPRTIYFARSGQSSIEHSYKADSDLSPAGWEYAERLKAAVSARRRAVREERKARGEPVDDNNLVVWTSARRRAHHTAWPFVHAGYKVVQKPIMGEINPGVWDGLSAQEAMDRYPDEWERFSADPYAHRAPRAESYHDLSVRLEPIIFESERCQDDLLIIGHASVIRCSSAYSVGLPPNEVPAIEMARGDLIEVTPASYGVVSRAFHFWSGEGRGDSEGKNSYENFAESVSSGAAGIGMAMFSNETENMEREAEAEEAKDKEAKAEVVRAKLKERSQRGGEGTMSVPHNRGGGTPEEPPSAPGAPQRKMSILEI